MNEPVGTRKTAEYTHRILELSNQNNNGFTSFEFREAKVDYILK